MTDHDRHGTRRISRIAALLMAVFFVAIGAAGFQRTGDSSLLLLFLVLAPVGFGVVMLLFRGVDFVLDSLNRRR
ncbi:MAG: hypothetical protein HWE39_08675 [Oceanospirillaceae bacterium]|nr:hypothetical protein [Oceanospirillaceae bacterium]